MARRASSIADPDIAPLIVAWQRHHGRHDLPWQNTRDPYRVWLSEVMLQQTQVATVLDYYPRFLARFADVQVLAAAPLDDVLALWSGLGYYSRARHLHRCAQSVVAEHGGRFPERADALVQLPGIGRSTAAAIAAFCFGERAAILDGNVKRVLTRALGFGEDLAVAANERLLWSRAEALLPARGIERYTQGLMDLGATLCSARAPRCDDCPLREVCVARRQGRPQAYPVKSRKLRRGRRHNALLWIERHDRRVWLTQRPATGVWAGLWTPPLFDAIAALQAAIDGWPGQREALPTIEHALTHFDWTLEALRLRLPARLSARGLARIEQALPAGAWFDLTQAASLALPAPIRKQLGPVDAIGGLGPAWHRREPTGGVNEP